MLAHEHDDCTGTWRIHEDAVSCSACGKAHPPTLEIRAAAMSENFAGRMLQRAAQRGSALLARRSG